jgi:hypothetical protein
MSKISDFVKNSRDVVHEGNLYKGACKFSRKYKRELYSAESMETRKRVFIPKAFQLSFARAGFRFTTAMIGALVDRISNTRYYSNEEHSKAEKARKWALLPLKVAAYSIATLASVLAVPVAGVAYAAKAIAHYRKEHSEE